MKNKKILVIIGIGILVLLIGIICLFMFRTKSIVLSKDYKKMTIKVSHKDDKVIILNVKEKSDIMISDVFVSNVDNYYVYFLKDINDKNVGKGIIQNKTDLLIRNVEKGKYKLYVVNDSDKKVKIDCKIKLNEIVDKKYAILQDGYTVRKKIRELTVGKDSYDSDKTIKKIKLAKEMNNKYRNPNYLVSSDTSNKDIYLWVDNDTLYFYSEIDISFGDDISNIFSNLDSLVDINDLKYFDFSNVKNAYGMFSSDSCLSDIKVISSFDTRNVEDVASMFNGCHSLVEITPFISFAMADLKNMSRVFSDTQVKNIDIMKYFDVSSVENMDALFQDTQVVDLSPIEEWETKKVSSVSFMFAGSRITNVDALSKWDVSNVVDMVGIFDECGYLKSIDGLKNWDTSSLERMSYAFKFVEATNLDALKNFKTDKLIELEEAFAEMRELKDINGIKDWNVSKVKKFSGLFALTAFEDTSCLKNWDLSKAEKTDNMFSHTKIKNLTGLKNWNVSNVKDFSDMFSTTQINSLDDISKWDVSNGEDFTEMFKNNSKLKDSSGIDNWKVNGNTTDMFINTTTRYPKWYS